MKKIFPLIPLLSVFVLSGCIKEPTASFDASATSIIAGESVNFTNTSIDMDRCEWMFGDGAQSVEIDPVHTYPLPGSYEVTLRVFSKNDIYADIAAKIIKVIQPTLLIVNVIDYENEDPVSNCLVELYKTEDDWWSQDNLVADGYTTSLGTVEFEDLDGGKYYINVFKQIDDYYFYCNWFIQYSGNTWNTVVEANKINEVEILAIKAYWEGDGRIAGN